MNTMDMEELKAIENKAWAEYRAIGDKHGQNTMPYWTKHTKSMKLRLRCHVQSTRP